MTTTFGRLVVLAVFALSAAACGSPGATSTEKGFGTVSARLVFPGRGDVGQIEPLALDTSDVHTVRLSALKGALTYVTRDFLYSAGSGTLDGVPVGTDYEIQILALDQNGVVLYSKRVLGVAVTGGANTSLGSVAMNPAEGLLYFLAVPNASSTARVLWSYDGFTAQAYTTMALGWNLGPEVAAYKGLLYFGAVRDVGSTVTTGLWSCDGSNPPVLVKELAAAPDGTLPSGFRVFRNVLYFTAYQDSAGLELWRTDGTFSGTVQVSDILAGAGGSSPADLSVYGGKLFFSAGSASAGTELYTFGGTGAPNLVDLVPGASGARPAALFPGLDALYLRGLAPSEGEELWAVDKYATVFTVLSDIRAGAAGSAPGNFALLDGTLFFSAGASAAVAIRTLPASVIDTKPSSGKKAACAG